MSAPLRVAVVRPKMTWGDFASKLIAGLFVSLLVAWLLLLVFEHLTGWDASYADALLVLAAARLLQINPNPSRWTHKAEGSDL